ncbi:hypothetical protein K488DRAFT_74195 [Vararia minispora EC-137]|uniref:Uncharacterized protein n=1 Tax=Vararia minispora EC-137 TaxID=1314806 RepID=A0ACB8Q7Y6_9AGAM|nr:hypothetical protein K488DRAFT_74195 [Vararia minispora EC-137]
MSSAPNDGPLTRQDLDTRTALAVFVRPSCPPDAVRTFETAFARGRDFADTWSARPARAPHAHESVDALAALCTARLATRGHPYHPHFFAVLDARTAADGSALLVHDIDGAGALHSLRCTPASMPVLLTVLSTGHTRIADVLANDALPGEEDAFVYDVPFDYAARQSNVRVPLNQFLWTDGPVEGFRTARLSASETAEAGAGVLPETDVELVWFGEPAVDDVLLLYGAHADGPDERRYLVGAVGAAEA